MAERIELLTAYNKGLYERFITLFNDYLNQGYGIDYGLITRYVLSAIRLRKFERAYNICKLVEDTNNNPEVDNDLFLYYSLIFKLKDAERILNKGNVNLKDKTPIVRLYLLQGNIDKAEQVLNEYLRQEPTQELYELQRQIYNKRRYDSFIEIEYQSLLNKGETLQPGHIVFLKQTPSSLADINKDEKNANRPYMIWKIEGKKLYLFPVTTSNMDNKYKLYKQNYRNSIGDRVIKDNLCYTNIDNVLSVCDKVIPEDFNNILKALYKTIYLSRSKKEKESNDFFMQKYHKPIEINDVLVIVDDNTKERLYYFVINSEENHYKVIEVNSDFHVISSKIELFRHDRLVYNVITIQEEQIQEIRSKIPHNLLIKSFLGAIIETIEGKFIVLGENKKYCICINVLYSPSYINLSTIKKDDIINTYGFKTPEEVEDIKEMILRNTHNNIDTMVMRLK